MKHKLFSTPLWHLEGISHELADELYQGAYRFKEEVFKEEYPSGDNRSSEGGYQTPFLKWKDFHPQGVEVINNLVYEAIEHEFKVQAWWFNINGKGHWNAPHTHPDCDLALVLYLTETDNLLTLVNPFSHRNYSGDRNDIIPKTKKGNIVIFPGDILHFVRPNPRDEDRISISMNLQLS